MSAGPPQKPAGAPPARPPPLDASRSKETIQGVGAIVNAPGAPRGAPPVVALKPPPMAPPPRLFMQTTQRPDVGEIRAITVPGPRGPPPTDSRPGTGQPPGTPGRPPPSTPMSRGPPPSTPKVATVLNAKGEKKEGAIAMFEGPAEPVNTPADPKKGPPPRAPPPRGPRPSGQAMVEAPGGRAARPLPPRPRAPGIPDGNPLPPDQAVPSETKPVGPIRPVPDRNRAPPREEPTQVAPIPARTAPVSQAPKVVRDTSDDVILKRREKDNPEFESSDDEDDKKEFNIRKVVQPKKPVHEISVEGYKKKDDDAENKVDIKAGIVPFVKPEQLSTPPPVQKDQPPPPDSMSIARNDSKNSVVSVKGEDVQQSAPPPQEDKPKKTAQAISLPPAKSMNESTNNSFIPPPPKEEMDSSKLILPRGRLKIRCIQGKGIRKKGEVGQAATRIDAFIKFRLGAAERLPWKQTETYRKQNDEPKFGDEVVFFDVIDPKQFILREDLQLCIEVWNRGALKDDPLGAVAMSVVRFFKNPFKAFTENVPIYSPGVKSTKAQLKLEFLFEQAKTGIFVFTLYEAVNLRNIDPMGNQDPYIQLSLGNGYVKKSKTIKRGGTDPYFTEEELMMWVDQENWVNPLNIHLLDEDLGMDKPIGHTQLRLLPYMNTNEADAKPESFDLFFDQLIDPRDPEAGTKEVPQGQVSMKVRYLPAGDISVFVENARDLAYPENDEPKSGDVTRMDPYVQLTLDGLCIQTVKRTPADKDGGKDAVWDARMNFEVVDQYTMLLEVHHESIQGDDILIGQADVSLLQAFRTGGEKKWVALKQKKANGGMKENGAVMIHITFTAPMGVAYPQLRPEIDSFDDSKRRMPTSDGKVLDNDEEESLPEGIATVPDDEEPVEFSDKKHETHSYDKLLSIMPAEAPQEKQEFTDSEIEAAFKFIDLDHNNFVGAKEIRHILVCMGEMITDDEIDMMISMVDSDGDGQVSFQEFKTLVLCSDPASTDLKKAVGLERENELLIEKQALSGKTQSLDYRAFNRQKEMTTREDKKKMLITFVSDNEATFDYIKNCYSAYLSLSKDKRPNGRLKFIHFCQALSVEQITEYKQLHDLFDVDGIAAIDFREFLLSMLNFVDVDREARMRFSFGMYDEMKTGYIAQREVEEILKGNHMISLESVKRKAETIMRQASKNAQGAMTANEFVVVSKKFPNILLPNYNGGGSKKK